MRVADPVRDLSGLAEARRRVAALRQAGTPIASDLFGYPSADRSIATGTSP